MRRQLLAECGDRQAVTVERLRRRLGLVYRSNVACPFCRGSDGLFLDEASRSGRCCYCGAVAGFATLDWAAECDFDLLNNASKRADAARSTAAKPRSKRVQRKRGGDSDGSDLGRLWKVEPWPDPVSGRELLGEITQLVRKYVVLPGEAPEAIALWILHSWTVSASTISPILAITSPEKRCGKTTLLQLLSFLVNRDLSVANITAPALFRTIDKFHPTLLIDEADTFLRGEDLRGVINSGHCRSSARVVRLVGDEHEPRVFSTWSPKAIALIGTLKGTLGDRSIEIRMRRRVDDERVDRLRADAGEKFVEFRRKCARWAKDNEAKLAKSEPDIPHALDDRAADNWRPLIAIADLAGGAWPARSREVALKLSTRDQREDQSSKVLLLEDIKGALSRFGSPLSSDRLVSHLAQLDNRPWPEWKRGFPITPRGVAVLLKSFRIEPKNVRPAEDRTKTVRGYELAQFEDAFARYLPPPKFEAEEAPR